MSTLVAIAYPTIDQARKALDAVNQMASEHLIELEDAVYVTKDEGGRIELHQTVSLPGTGAVTGGASGALWGGLIGLLFLQPLAGAAIGAAVGAGTGAVVGAATDYGIDDDFIRQLSTRMTPHSSALFVLIRRATEDRVISKLATFGGTLLQTSLSQDAEQRLQEALTQAASQAVRPTAPPESTPPA